MNDVPYYFNSISKQAYTDLRRDCKDLPFNYLAKYYPHELMDLIKRNALPEYDLSIAIDATYYIEDEILLKETLLPLLTHKCTWIIMDTATALRHHIDEHVATLLFEVRDTHNNFFVKDHINYILGEYYNP